MLKLKCRKHPRYAGVQSPRASCQACITLRDLRLKAIVNYIQIVEPPKRGSNEPTD